METLLVACLSTIVLSGFVLVIGFLTRETNVIVLEQNGIKYLKAPSQEALNAAIQLNMAFKEICMFASGIVVLGGLGINPYNLEEKSLPLKYELSKEDFFRIQSLVENQHDILDNSYEFYQKIRNQYKNLLEEENTSSQEDFTVLAFNNDYNLLAICQARKLYSDPNLWFKASLHFCLKESKNKEWNTLEYNFFVESLDKDDRSHFYDMGVTRTWYQVGKEINESFHFPQEGPIHLVLPDPYLLLGGEENEKIAISRFHYHVDAKK